MSSQTSQTDYQRLMAALQDDGSTLYMQCRQIACTHLQLLRHVCHRLIASVRQVHGPVLRAHQPAWQLPQVC